MSSKNYQKRCQNWKHPPKSVIDNKQNRKERKGNRNKSNSRSKRNKLKNSSLRSSANKEENIWKWLNPQTLFTKFPMLELYDVYIFNL